MLIINATTDSKNETYLMKTLIPTEFSKRRTKVIAKAICMLEKLKLRLGILEKITNTNYIAPDCNIIPFTINYINATIHQLKNSIQLIELGLRNKKYKIHSINITKEMMQKEYTRIYDFANKVTPNAFFIQRDLEKQKKINDNFLTKLNESILTPQQLQTLNVTLSADKTEHIPNENIYNRKTDVRNLVYYFKTMQLYREQLVQAALHHEVFTGARHYSELYPSCRSIIGLYIREAIKKYNLCANRINKIAGIKDIKNKSVENPKPVPCAQLYNQHDCIKTVLSLTPADPRPMDCQETMVFILSGKCKLITEQCRVDLLEALTESQETFIADSIKDYILPKYQNDIIDIMYQTRCQLKASLSSQDHFQSDYCRSIAYIKNTLNYNDQNEPNTDDELKIGRK